MATTWGDTRTGGRWLRNLREQMGLTQRELEKKSGVSYAVISQMENGAVDKVPLVTLVKLGQALGFDPNTAAQRYGYWFPTKAEATNEPDEITFLKNVLARLSVGQRYALLQSVEALAQVAERNIEK